MNRPVIGPSSPPAEPPGSLSATPLLGGRTLDVLAGLTLLFVLQSGLAPFDFGRGKPANIYFEINNPSLPDRLSNICLYIPLAFVAHLALAKRIARPSVAAVLVIVGAGALSAGIEWIQHYSPVRVSSLMDIVCNMTGAAIGAALAFAGQLAWPKLVARAAGEVRARTPAAAIKAYCLLLLVAASLPFSFSLEVSRLKEQVKSAVLVPFGESSQHREQVLAAQQSGNETLLGYVALHRLKRWSRWSAEALSFVLLAWLLYPFLRNDYEFSRPGAAGMTLWLGGLMAVAFSALQFAIISRGLDTTDIVFRWTGLAAGLLTCAALSPWARPAAPREWQARAWRRTLRLGIAGACGFIVYNGVIPLWYDWSADRVPQSVASEAFVPFVSYFQGRFDLMTADIVEKLAAFATLAGLLAMWARLSDGRGAKAASWVSIALLCVVISGAVEIVQMFDRVRVPSLTDPILAASGAILGLLGYRYAVRFYGFAAAGAMDRALHCERGLGPVDELIATLTQPYDQAPVEPDLRPGVPRRI